MGAIARHHSLQESARGRFQKEANRSHRCRRCYDAEHAYMSARETLHIKSIIPNRVERPTTKLPSGKYRRLMTLRFDTEKSFENPGRRFSKHLLCGSPKWGGFHLLYSKISPGWHSSVLQIASKVDNRIAFALPFFNTEMFAMVMPTFSASSVTLTFRLANITSMFITIAIDYTVKSFSDFSSTALCKVFSNTAAAVATTAETKIRTRPIITPPAMSSSTLR